jgi:hypothetical protein
VTTASDLLARHLQTLVRDPEQWQTLIADDIVWELAYAPAIGHPARLTGREEVMRHVAWFLGAVESFRFFDVRLYAFADPQSAVPPGLRAFPPCRRRQNCVPTRVFRSRARGQGFGRPDSRPGLVRASGIGADMTGCRAEPSPNKALHLSGPHGWFRATPRSCSGAGR